MKYIKQIKKLEQLSRELKGIYSANELEMIFNTKSKSTFFNIIKSLQGSGIITKFKKGLYITENFDPLLLSARIDPNSYISLETVLSRNAVIGTIPYRQISAVRVGRNRFYATPELRIKHYGINANLFFGFTIQDGIKIADSEKAFIDLLYYKTKGAKFMFNIYSDINYEKLNFKKVFEYLKAYKNKKFVSYCKGIINEK